MGDIDRSKAMAWIEMMPCSHAAFSGRFCGIMLLINNGISRAIP
jgi:hypothetical protein